MEVGSQTRRDWAKGRHIFKAVARHGEREGLVSRRSCSPAAARPIIRCPKDNGNSCRQLERFAEWAEAKGNEVFPLTSATLIQYALHLDNRECGPSVIPTFRTSVKWVTAKLAIECPDFDHQGLLAIQADVISKRARTLKEAIPIPTQVVRSMELFAVDDQEPEPSGCSHGGGYVWCLHPCGSTMPCMFGPTSSS